MSYSSDDLEILKMAATEGAASESTLWQAIRILSQKAIESANKPEFTYYGNWDFGDPICRAQPGKFLPVDDKTRENFRIKGFPVPSA